MSLKFQRWDKATPTEAGTLRRQLESEGYSVSEGIDQPGTIYESHAHEDDQTHWIISGEVEFVVEGETYRLGAGDRDFLPANTDHAAAVLGDQPVHYLTGVKNS